MQRIYEWRNDLKKSKSCVKMHRRTGGKLRGAERNLPYFFEFCPTSKIVVDVVQNCCPTSILLGGGAAVLPAPPPSCIQYDLYKKENIPTCFDIRRTKEIGVQHVDVWVLLALSWNDRWNPALKHLCLVRKPPNFLLKKIGMLYKCPLVRDKIYSKYTIVQYMLLILFSFCTLVLTKKNWMRSM